MKRAKAILTISNELETAALKRVRFDWDLYRIDNGLKMEEELGFISKRHYVKLDGDYGYTGWHDTDSDLVEFFVLSGPLKGKRKIVDVFSLDIIKTEEEKQLIQVLYEKVTNEK